MPVGDAGHERAELDLAGDRRHVGERRVALVHVEVGRSDHRQLEEVVHHPQGREPGVLRCACDIRQDLSLILR
jgi:hypothetical protein